MSENQITIIILSILSIIWISLSLLFFSLINKQLDAKYKKFYPHPLVGIIKDFKNDSNFKKHEIIYSSIFLGIFWLPITPIWFIFWLLYKFSYVCFQLYFESDDNDDNNYTKPELSIKYVPTTLRDIYNKLPISIEEDQFLNLYNLVESELALEYFPLYYEEILNKDTTGKIKYSSFKYCPIRIISVKSVDEKDLKFRLYPKSIKLFDAVDEKFYVKYSYNPNKKESLDDESSYLLMDYFYILSFGILGEYYLQLGDFEKASDYNTIYRREISTLSNVK